MNFSFYIAKRYLISKSSQSTVNIINLITFLVIVIGAAALFIVLSGFAGLKIFSVSFTTSFNPDLKVTSAIGKFITIAPEQEQKLKAISGIASYSKELEERVYLAHKEKNYSRAYIKGIDAHYNKVTQIDSSIYYGTWLSNTTDQVVVGYGISNYLGLGINDYYSPLKIVVPRLGKGSITSSRRIHNDKKTTISGIYSINEDLDKKYVFAELPLVQALLEKDSLTFTGINIKLTENASETAVKDQIASLFNNDVFIRNRIEQNGALYKMLNTENIAIYLIFTLVLIIALFNLVGAIIMMILDKQENSKTLYHLGTTIKELRRIYFTQGILVTLVGGVLGVSLAAILVWSQQYFGWLKITPTLAYPVALKFVNFIIVIATITVLGIIASKIASSRITKKLIS